MSYCLSCGKLIEDWDGGYYTRNMLCIPCYQAEMADSIKKQCFSCGRRIRPEEGGSNGGRFFCESCLAAEKSRIEKITCAGCKRVLEPWEGRHATPDGKLLCDNCYTAGMGRLGGKMCYRCGKVTDIKFVSSDGKNFCPKCSAIAEKEIERVREKGAFGKLSGIVRRIMSGDRDDDEEK